jgi:hypothetical protein
MKIGQKTLPHHDVAHPADLYSDALGGGYERLCEALGSGRAIEQISCGRLVLSTFILNFFSQLKKRVIILVNYLFSQLSSSCA